MSNLKYTFSAIETSTFMSTNGSRKISVKCHSLKKAVSFYIADLCDDAKTLQESHGLHTDQATHIAAAIKVANGDKLGWNWNPDMLAAGTSPSGKGFCVIDKTGLDNLG